jgi:excisionase family DNA binding protein
MMQRITVTLKQATEASGLSVRKLYGLIAEGKLKSVTVGRRRLVLYKSLEELLLGKTGK